MIKLKKKSKFCFIICNNDKKIVFVWLPFSTYLFYSAYYMSYKTYLLHIIYFLQNFLHMSIKHSLQLLLIKISNIKY